MSGKIKILIVFLLVSLTANIFIAGMFIGRELRGSKARHYNPPEVEFNVKRLNRLLNEEDQQKVREILRQKRREMRGNFGEMKASEKRIQAILTAETVDNAALFDAIESHGELVQRLHEPIKRIMMEVVADQDLETRQKFAGEMFKRDFQRHMKGERPFGPGGRRSGPPPGERGDVPPHKGDGNPPPPPPEDEDGSGIY